MNEIGLNQCIKEIELALSTTVEPLKTPVVSSYDEGTALFIRVSWVVESNRAISFELRRNISIRFSAHQMHRYAEMGAAKRLVVCARLCQMVRDRIPANRKRPQLKGDRSASLSMDDRLLEFGLQPTSVDTSSSLQRDAHRGPEDGMYACNATIIP